VLLTRCALGQLSGQGGRARHDVPLHCFYRTSIYVRHEQIFLVSSFACGATTRVMHAMDNGLLSSPGINKCSDL
jgi:hypothetical protein